MVSTAGLICGIDYRFHSWKKIKIKKIKPRRPGGNPYARCAVFGSGCLYVSFEKIKNCNRNSLPSSRILLFSHRRALTKSILSAKKVGIFHSNPWRKWIEIKIERKSEKSSVLANLEEGKREKKKAHFEVKTVWQPDQTDWILVGVISPFTSATRPTEKKGLQIVYTFRRTSPRLKKNIRFHRMMHQVLQIDSRCSFMKQ